MVRKYPIGLQSFLPTTLLFQTGYLTIKQYNPEVGFYVLDFPNKEVRQSMQVFMLSAHIPNKLWGNGNQMLSLR